MAAGWFVLVAAVVFGLFQSWKGWAPQVAWSAA